MKRLILTCCAALFSPILFAQSSFSAGSSASKTKAGQRPEIERTYELADRSETLVYYRNATVSYCKGTECSDMYVVHNITEPERMVILKQYNSPNDTLYFSRKDDSYFNKAENKHYQYKPLK